MRKNFTDFDKTCVFLSPNKVILGKNVIQQLSQEVKSFNGKKVLIVSDAGVLKAGVVAIIQKVLADSSVETGVFDKVEPEPAARIVDECVQMVNAGSYDIIVGVGGGSTLDVAKATAAVASNGGNVLEYVGFDKIPQRGLPKILIPTTAGTGSESSRVSVITDESDNTKKVVYSNFLLADVVVLDPVLTCSVPPSVTADTGIDALVHAIETYVSMNSTPFSEILAMEAIRLISRNLAAAYSKGSNIEARYNMLLAANLAGSAFTSGGLGAVHGLAYVLGTEYHMSHGRSNAIMLPHVMTFNLTGNLDKYADIAEAMGENIAGLSRDEAAEKSVNAVKKLLQAVNISWHLSDYNIEKKDLPLLVAGGLKQARLFVTNPKDLNDNDVESIYSECFQ